MLSLAQTVTRPAPEIAHQKFLYMRATTGMDLC